MKKHNFIIPLNLHRQRIDKALSLLLEDISRSSIQKSVKSSNVILNNQIISDSSILVKENDIVHISLLPEEASQMQPTAIDFEVVFEDDYLIVINKPAGLSVHPGAGNYQNTLANGLLYYSKELSDIGGMMRPGIVHRLDKDTSGLMVVAKNNIIHEKLAKKIQDRSLVRKYKALIWGMINPNKGMIECNIARNRIDRKKMSVSEIGGKKAITFYNTDQIFLNGKISFITCKLETGRTHQIRVHLSHIGHSVIGDQTYGHNSRKIFSLPLHIQELFRNFKRQALHSYYLSFEHPITKRFLEFQIDLPEDIKALMNILGCTNI